MNCELCNMYRTRRVTCGDVPPCLSGACAVMLDSEASMFLIGGHSYEGKVNSVYQLSVTSCRWLDVSEPEPLHNFSPRDKFAAWEYYDRLLSTTTTTTAITITTATTIITTTAVATAITTTTATTTMTSKTSATTTVTVDYHYSVL